MAYAASALSFMLENLAKPVIFTGSMIPFVHGYSDARRNLIVSIQVKPMSTFFFLLLFMSRHNDACFHLASIDAADIRSVHIFPRQTFAWLSIEENVE